MTTCNGKIFGSLLGKKIRNRLVSFLVERALSSDTVIHMFSIADGIDCRFTKPFS